MDWLRSLGRWLANEARFFFDICVLVDGLLLRMLLVCCGRFYAFSSCAVFYFAYFFYRCPADIGLADSDVPRTGVFVALVTVLANTFGVSDLREPNVHITVLSGFTLVVANCS